MADEPAAIPDDAMPGSVPASDSAAPVKKRKKKPQDDLDPTKIYVKVFSPYQTFFEGDAKSMSAENDTGPFDILPKHHNFISLVNECEVVIRVDGDEDKKLRITRGVLHVRSNKVTLFLDV